MSLDNYKAFASAVATSLEQRIRDTEKQTAELTSEWAKTAMPLKIAAYEDALWVVKLWAKTFDIEITKLPTNEQN